MTTEIAGRSELAQLVTHHILGYVYGNELISVVDSYRLTDEIILARDQVLMTVFLFPSACATTFASSLGSMNGPFFNERLIMILYLIIFSFLK